MKRHTELLAEKQNGAAGVKPEGNPIEAYALPEVRGHQEISDEILAAIDIDAALEASFESESSASKKAPPDKAKVAAAARKNFTGAVKLNIEKQKGKPTAKPAAKGSVASLF